MSALRMDLGALLIGPDAIFNKMGRTCLEYCWELDTGTNRG